MSIPDDEQDKSLPDRLREELPGILAWAVAGCRLWQEEGLTPPEAVMVATSEYRSESDTVGRCIDEICFQGPNARSSATELYQAYAKWAEQNGETPMSQTMFGRKLTERGFEKVRDTITRRFVWRGIGLLAQ
jgi:putative DNA primase/helicase